MNTNDVFDAFLAYHIRDAVTVLQLKHCLHEKGCRVWLCRPYPKDSKDWVQPVREVLGNCQSIIVTIGPGGVGGTERYEWLHFYHENYRGVVIPVLLPGGSWYDSSIPGLLLDLKRITFCRSIDESDALMELVSAIRGWQ